MIRELILVTNGAERRFLGSMGPASDFCAADYCPIPCRPINSAAVVEKEIT